MTNPSVNIRGALVLFEGLLPTVIDSQVLTHVRLVRELLGINIPIIAFACTADVYEQSQASFNHACEIAGGEVHLYRGVRPALPGSHLVNRIRLSDAIRRVGQVSFLHVRGDYAAAVTGPLVKSLALPMLWDCRGDSRAELHERLGSVSSLMQLPLALRAWMSGKDSKNAGRACAAACFVSQALRDLMAGYIGSKPSWVLPCLANEEDFFFDQPLRQRMRTQLGFGADDAVYVYSGGLASYQCFDEVVDAFRKVAGGSQAVRLVVLTPYVDAARKLLVDLPQDRVICKAVKNAEVNDYLNAADFSFLLRDDTAVNRVAFPTKFAEYALAGLQVIMKGAPPSCASQARELGNYVPLEKIGMAAAFAAANRGRIATMAKQRMGRRASIERFSEIYRKLLALTPTSGR